MTCLYLALHQIRHISKPKLLWVDAICIKQEDTEERNQQVALMHGADAAYLLCGFVYFHRARRTINPTTAMPRGFELILKIPRAKGLDIAFGIHNCNL